MKRLTIGIIFLSITFVLSSTAWAKGDVHTITSENFTVFQDATGAIHAMLGGNAKCTISWKENHRCGFLNAKISAGKDQFEIRLASIGNCDTYTIEGLFDIYKNGNLEAEGVVGKIQDMGSVVSFSAGTSQCNDGPPLWAFVAVVDYRFDF